MTRMVNGAIRGLLAAILVATPSLLVPSVSSDTAEVVTLVGLAVALLVTVEYSSTYPSLVEFRDAPPFNRIRFLGLFVTVFLVSVIARGQEEPSGLTLFVMAVGHVAGILMDFPLSPAEMLVRALPETASPADVLTLRASAGLAFFCAFFSFLIFYLALKLSDWPRSMGAFNVWINLPTFDPTSGSDVVTRLRRDARVNLILGACLPFLLPSVARAAGAVFGTEELFSGHAMIWTVAAWAFLPLSLFMRAVAMSRVADMILEMRRRSAPSAPGVDDSLSTPAE